jgi:hypothetical protein
MSRTVMHNRCRHCFKAFTKGCVGTALCDECAEEGHTEGVHCLKCWAESMVLTSPEERP